MSWKKSGIEVQCKNMLKKFDCMEEDGMKEYFQCKMVYNQAQWLLKIIQTVLKHSFEDECKKLRGHNSSSTWIYSFDVWPEEQADVKMTNKILLKLR